MRGERLPDQARCRRGLALLDQPAEALEALLEHRIGELERPAQKRPGLAPVGLLEARESALEGPRLLDRALGRERAQRLERLADQAFARVEQRPLDARRDVAGMEPERALERVARLGPQPARELDPREMVVEVGEAGL